MHRIFHDYIYKSFAVFFGFIVKHSIAGERFSVLVNHIRTVQEHHLLGIGIVPSQRAVNVGLVLINNVCGACNARNIRFGIVAHAVGIHFKVSIHELHAIAKHGIVCSRRILSPNGSKRVFGIHNFSSGIVIGQIGIAVVVQTVGGKRCFAVFHAHILTQTGHTGISIIKQKIAVHEQRIALHNAYIAECIERIGFLIEISAVAIEQCVVVTEAYISPQNLHIGVYHFVEINRFGVFEIDNGGFRIVERIDNGCKWSRRRQWLWFAVTSF